MANPVEVIRVLEDEWHGCYRAGWQGLIMPESFAHPAKFSRALIRRIYDHVIEEGWASRGDSVVDPFGGVALGALDAMRHGLNWYGCELEAKFVGLGGQNIALWNGRFSRMPNWGTARLIQGDSRKLAEVLSVAECCVSSPPYADGCAHTGGDDPKPEHLTGGDYHGVGLAVTSPPYANDTVNDRNGIDQSLIKKPGGHNSQSRKMANYGEASGQLGAMKEGDHSIAICSPPYAAISPEKSSRSVDYEKQYATYRSQGGGASFEKFVATQQRHSQGYGYSDGQLSAMKGEGFECAVSSPPFESSLSRGRLSEELLREMAQRGHKPASSGQSADYGATEGNTGNMQGETFWSASRLILEQLNQVIVPGGHALFVVKAFVRNKQIVDFPGQWAQLCEAVGFRLLHHHRASLVEHSGTQGGFDEDKEIRVERKSFFRRLAESKAHHG